MESKDMLLGQLKAHHQETTRRLDTLETQLEHIDVKIDGLQRFKWQVMGVIIFISTIIAFIRR